MFEDVSGHRSSRPCDVPSPGEYALEYVKSVARSGLSQTSVETLLWNQEPSQPTLTTPRVFDHSSAAPTSVDR